MKKILNTNTNGILSLFLAFVMLLGMLPMNTLTAFAAETTYPLKIAGVEVTSDNCTAITDDAISGTVSYDPTTNTLTLNGATITSAWYYIISYTGTEDFTINLVGENTLTTNAANTPCINADSAKIIISGGGSLTATGGSSSLGIYVSELAINNTTVTANGSMSGIQAKNITISGSTVNATATDSYGSGIQGTYEGTITIENGSKVAATGESGYGIYASGGFSVSGSTLTANDSGYGLYVEGNTTISGTSHILASSGTQNLLGQNSTLTLPTSTYYWRNSDSGEFTASTSTPATESNVKTAYFELYTDGHTAYTPNDDGTTHSLGCPDGCAVDTLSSGTSEAHTWEDGECKVCGATCVHDENTVYENGFCTCGGYEPAVRVTADNYKDLGFTAENYEGYSKYYAIANAGQLYWFADRVNGIDPSAKAVLTDNIVVNTGVLDEYGNLVVDTDSFKDWTPIGDATYKYTGTFDGRGHTISGLYFSNESTDYVGLFGLVYNGTVKNVGVVDSYFCGKNDVGGVVGHLYANFGSASVENCYNTGIVKGTGDDVGGVVGYLYANDEGSRATVTNCYNTGNVSGNPPDGYSYSNYIGGVVGLNMAYSGTATVANCYNTGNVSSSGGSYYVGGVAGSNEVSDNGTATIENCYYLTNCATDGGGYTQQGIGANGSGNTTADVVNEDNTVVTAVKDEVAFKSGEVAYLLNGDDAGTDAGVWKQTLGDNGDASPNFTGKTVYQSGTGYTNHEHNWSYEDGAYDYQIYATCTAEDCTLTGRVTITLGALGGTYTGDAHTASVLADSSEFTVREDAITYTANNGGTLTNGLPVNAGSYTATLTLGEGTDAKEAKVTYTIAPKDITGATVGTFGDLTYTGEAQTPSATVTLDDKTVTGSWSAVTNVGEESTFTASGNYTGTLKGNPGMKPKALTITGATIEDVLYNENGGYTLKVTGVTFDGATLTIGTDYTVSAVLAGTNEVANGVAATVTVNLINGNYSLNSNTFNGSVNIITHTHVWSYSASGATITAKCEGKVGTCPVGTVTITLKAPTSLTYDGSAKVVTVEQYPANVFNDVPTEISAENYTGERTNVTANGFTATLTYGGETATLTCKITPKELTITGIGPVSKDYDGTTALELSDIVLSGILDGDEVSIQCEDENGNNLYTIQATTANVGYNYITVTGLPVLPLSGADAGNYILQSYDETTIFSTGNDYYNIYQRGVYIYPDDQYITIGGSIEQGKYTLDPALVDGHTLTGVLLVQDDDNKQITVNTESVKVTDGNGNDVTGNYEFYDYSTGTMIITCEGHTFDANGFCATGECQTYEKPELVDGTDEWGNPTQYYEIENAGQLFWFAEQVNNVSGGNYSNGKLMNDIVVNPGTFAADGTYTPKDGETVRAWTPIGDYSNWSGFYGWLNGDGHTISGLYCTDVNYAGLIGYMGAYTYDKIGISNSYFKGDVYTGAIAAYMDGSTINNCFVAEDVYLAGSTCGGIAGYNSYGTINTSYSMAKLADGTYAGAVGSNYGTLNHCYYLSETETDDGGKTADQFASGEVAYLLQSGILGEEVYDEETDSWVTQAPAHIWGQSIGTENYPVFGGAKVYQKQNCNGNTLYRNIDEDVTHNYGELIPATEEVHTSTELKGAVEAHYYCTVCGIYFTVDKTATTLAALTGEAPTHTFGDEWQTGDGQHWKECFCGAQSELAVHTYVATTHTCVCGDVEKFVSVTITWGAMSFTYDDALDAEGNEKGWICDDGANVITIENTGNTDVTVTYTYEQVRTEIEGSFTDGTNTVTKMTILATEKKSVWLILKNKPTAALTDAHLGTVKLTIE